METELAVDVLVMNVVLREVEVQSLKGIALARSLIIAGNMRDRKV